MRIGINVPDELMKQIKQVRPEVNVSQVCREALTERVEVARRAADRAISDGMEEHVQRLDQSVAKPPIEPDWEGYALDDARAWVRTVTPESWEQFVYQADFLRRQGRDETQMVDIWSHGDGGVGLAYRLDENREWLISQHQLDFELGTNSNPRERAVKAYGRAWLGYVHEIRRLLDRHRRDEYNRVMAERAELRRSRPDPELPLQLV